jgi:D-glycero-D-manno-heptose 1,7-bisphosphate phosphatase
MKRPAIFLDRDGTLIEEVSYLSRVEDLRLFPFSANAVWRLKDAGFRMIVVTNQSGIGRGLYTEATMHEINRAIQDELSGAVDAFYFCPHVPGSGCECRKPKVGMITAAARELEVSLQDSWMVGDKASDIGTGKSAGLLTALVLTGYGAQHKEQSDCLPDVIVEDLGKAADEIIRRS